jgi:hypothetical protein
MEMTISSDTIGNSSNISIYFYPPTYRQLSKDRHSSRGSLETILISLFYAKPKLFYYPP